MSVVVIGADAEFEGRCELILDDDLVIFAPASVDAVVSRIVHLAHRPELLVLGSHMPTDQALELASATRSIVDGIVLISTTAGIAGPAAASGINEVIQPGIDSTALRLLFERAVARSEARTLSRGATATELPKEGRTIVVASPKGGVGKTTIACNIAMGLATLAPGDVVIVDLDLQFGDVATALRLSPRRSVEDAVSNAAARDASVLKMFLTEHGRGLQALCAPASPASADLISAAQLSHLLRQLASQFSYVVVDTSPGLSDHTLAVLERATHLVTVTSMDVASARGLVKELDVLREIGLLPDSRQLVLNLADRAAGMTVAAVEKELGAAVDIVVPRSRAVAVGTNTGVPVVVGSPRDAAARSLRMLVHRLHSEPTRRNWRNARRKENIA